ncbi:MAG: hypothetical protein MZU97_18530 [Bacillus subtilis]|nr:hypothetical protein [Bacillus subtilis]
MQNVFSNSVKIIGYLLFYFTVFVVGSDRDFVSRERRILIFFFAWRFASPSCWPARST